MIFLRSASILVLSACALQAQMTTRPTTAQPGTVVIVGADLIVTALNMTAPNLLGGGASEDGDRVSADGVFATANITNRGNRRWGARGSVGFTLAEGREADEAPSGRREPSVGVSTVPGSPGILRGVMAPFGPYRAEVSIPGSLGPGESRVVRVMLTTRTGSSRMILARDKYYTLTGTIRAAADLNESNNRATQVGRITAAGATLNVRWDPIAYRAASEGTVRVNAPPR